MPNRIEPLPREDLAEYEEEFLEMRRKYAKSLERLED